MFIIDALFGTSFLSIIFKASSLPLLSSFHFLPPFEASHFAMLLLSVGTIYIYISTAVLLNFPQYSCVLEHKILSGFSEIEAPRRAKSCSYLDLNVDGDDWCIFKCQVRLYISSITNIQS